MLPCEMLFIWHPLINPKDDDVLVRILYFSWKNTKFEGWLYPLCVAVISKPCPFFTLAPGKPISMSLCSKFCGQGLGDNIMHRDYSTVVGCWWCIIVYIRFTPGSRRRAATVVILALRHLLLPRPLSPPGQLVGHPNSGHSPIHPPLLIMTGPSPW